MSDKDKPEITATIRFRGVTIEGMTIEELRALRDLLNQLVGEKVTERVVERHEYVPWRPYWTTIVDATYPTGTLQMSDNTAGFVTNEVVITCAN